MEQRREGRIEHQVKFFFEILECEDDLDMVGTSIECETVDFSCHGLQFYAEQEIVPEMVLNITIGVGNPFSMYLLRGIVRWVLTSEEEDGCWAGVEMQEAEGTDLPLWINQFENTFGMKAT